MKSLKTESSSTSSNESKSSQKPLLNSSDHTKSSDEYSLDHGVTSKGLSTADHTVLIVHNIHAGLENTESGISSQNAPSEIMATSQENSNVSSNGNEHDIEVNSVSSLEGSRPGMKNNSRGAMSNGNAGRENRTGDISLDSFAADTSSCDSYCKVIK